jgi:hypothetical protein
MFGLKITVSVVQFRPWASVFSDFPSGQCVKFADARRRATHRDVMETSDDKRPDEFTASGSTK